MTAKLTKTDVSLPLTIKIEMDQNIDTALEGKILFGDNLGEEGIRQWYREEAEAYAELGSKDRSRYEYGYDALNMIHGFSKLGTRSYGSVLGFGSAWGSEFLPVAQLIEKLTIIEPSLQMRSSTIANLTPHYVTPRSDGTIEMDDCIFDLVTILGVLHHIPNVSYVFGELIRVLKVGGLVILREPIISMGDWRMPRKGLTKNERGIPTSYFDTLIRRHNMSIISKVYCFTLTSFLQRTLLGTLLARPLCTYPAYVRVDKWISKFLSWNIHYHAKTYFHKVAPSNVYYVLRKTK